MSSTSIPADLRRRVSIEARQRCGYCQTQELVIGSPLEIDHLVPESLGGLTVLDNLWLACSPCNDHKSNRLLLVDPISGDRVPIFNPRQHSWREHFAWSLDSTRIDGLTPVGRATVAALRLNRPSLVLARGLWVAAGWHPPAEAEP